MTSKYLEWNGFRQRISLMQDAVKHSKTFEKLQDSFRKKPDPPFSQKATLKIMQFFREAEFNQQFFFRIKFIFQF